MAECQETILNLGKQLKALASPAEAALFDKVILTPADNNAASATTPEVITDPVETMMINSPTPEKKVQQRSSLLDKMLAEDDADTEDHMSPKTKEIILHSEKHVASCTNEAPDTLKRPANSTEVDHHKNEVVVGSLAIVPNKKKGGRGILRKLFGMGKRKTVKEK